MPTALEDIRARLDRGLGRAPADVPTLDSLKARIDRGMGRSTSPAPATSEAPTLESLRAQIQAAKGLPPVPRRKPEVPGITEPEQEPYTPEPPQEPFAHRPRAPRPTMRLPRASVPGEVDEPQSLTRSALHGIVQGAAGGVAGFPEAVGIGRQGAARGLLAQYDKIDRGGMPDPQYKMLGGPAMFYLTSDAETRQRLRDEARAAIRPIAEEPAYQIGQSIRESTAGAFPVAPEHEGRFPVQLGRGVGSTATFLGTGLVGRLFRLPSLPVIAGTGAIANSSETFRDAIDRGASFEDAFTASRMAGVVGTSEAVPIVKLLDRLDDATGGQVRRMIVRTVQGGLEEGAQELFQNIAENLIASKLVAYDPERGLFQGSGDAAGVGFTVGALFNALASMLGAKMRRSPQQVTEQTVREFTEHVVREPEGVPAPARRPAERGEPFARGQAPIAPGTPTGESPATPEGPVVPRPAVFTSEAEGRPDLPPATGAPKRVKISPEAGLGVPETTEVKGPDGSVRVEVIRKPSQPGHPLGEIKFRSVRRSTESYLDEAAKRRNVPTLNKDQKVLAEEARKSNLAAFDAAHQELVHRTYAGTQGGVEPAGVEIETITARDKRTTFEFPPTEEGLENLLATKKQYEKLPAQTTGYGMQVPDLESIRARVDRAMGRQPAAEGALPETAYAGAGAAYQGFVQDQVEGVAPAVPTKPLRREDILRPLLKALNVPLYQGRMKGRKLLGFYRRHVEEVRIKRMNDIEVAAHELAHLFDDRFPEIRRQWLPASKANAEIREELRGVSYDKSKLFEGFAEFVRLWSTQREEAKARAPKFYGWFEDFVAGNEHGPALRKAQEDMHAWFAQDAVSRARSKIGVTKAINAGLTTFWDRFRQAVADDLHGIYRMERELTGTINPVGPYETARLTRAKHAMIEGALLYGAPVVKPDGSHAFEGKGLSQILDPVADRLDDLQKLALTGLVHARPRIYCSAKILARRSRRRKA
ncbi:MAG: hypothetical protein IID48_17070 [Proteobacteria bacterium]|nr:hypothetical protein [Pseudomonadota bacterium]